MVWTTPASPKTFSNLQKRKRHCLSMRFHTARDKPNWHLTQKQRLVLQKKFSGKVGLVQTELVPLRSSQLLVGKGLAWHQHEIQLHHGRKCSGVCKEIVATGIGGALDHEMLHDLHKPYQNYSTTQPTSKRSG